MTSYSWNTDTSGDWNTGTLWTGGTVPNDVPAADVTIDAASTLTAYTVTIASGASITVDSLSMNDVNERAGRTIQPATTPLTSSSTERLPLLPVRPGRGDGSLQTTCSRQPPLMRPLSTVER